MIKFVSENEHQEAITFVRNFVNALSVNNVDAFQHFDKGSDHPNDAENIFKDFLTEYADKVNPSQIDSPYSLNLDQERANIYIYDDDSGFALDYDLPIHKQWSDFTAQFSFKRKTDSLYFVYLDAIHVL